MISANIRYCFMKKTLLICCYLLTFPCIEHAYCQSYVSLKNATESLKKSYLEALQLNKKGDFERSVKVFSKILKSEPRFIDARIQLGAALEELKSVDLAIDEYKNVLKIDTLYEPKVLKALGRLLKGKGNYQEAAYFYQRFSVLSTNNQDAKDASANEARNCLFIANTLVHKKEIQTQNLGPNINTQANEYLPCLSVDGQTMIFTRVVNGNEDFYQSHKNSQGVWEKAMAISELNTPLNEGAQTISADGKTLVFVACDYPDSYGSCDLYVSYQSNGIWSKPKNMGIDINTGSWETQPSLSADGKLLYFTSNRPGGFGDSDIWISIRNSQGKWQKPKPLPAPINDAKKSESPFIHPDGKTLYFRSNRQPGMGGFDIYFSKLSEDGSWSVPINLGSPINTVKDEGALIVSTDGVYGYYASDVENQSATQGGIINYGRNDIYQFTLPQEFKPAKVAYLKARVVDEETDKPISATAQLVQLKTATNITELITESDGVFMVCIPAGESYALNVSKQGYVFYSANFTLDTFSKADAFVMDVRLQKISVESNIPHKPVILNNIFFDSGSSGLKSESQYELRKLLSMLQENPVVKIQVNGHTDDIGNDADNLKLSENRAKAVCDYLIKNGISSDRLSFKGYGELKPLLPNKDEQSRQKNRRTEFEIK